MFFKRIATIVLALILLVGVIGCSSKSPTDIVNSQYQEVGKEEIHNDNSSSVDEQDENDIDSKEEIGSDDNLSQDDDLNQDISKNETDNTSSENDNQNTNTQNPDDDKEANKNDYDATDCNHDSNYTDPYVGISKMEFYADYTTACCNLDAGYRSKHGLLSGGLDIPGQYAIETENRPTTDGMLIRNTSTIYLDDGNTYLLLDANGKEVMRIHKAGGYITLEEVAAYMYAFGGSEQIPANYTSSKRTKPYSSIWGEYLRVNHSYFIGDTDEYPYEPELPDILGCGGSLRYYEMDIGTTGTVTPGYAAKPYIQGNKVNRGAARLVYARQDLNGNGEYECDEVYVFYTHNHYNDFREYLNYYGGWSEMFGNVTGGGEYSSKTNANPTPYVQTYYDKFYKQ